MPETAPQILTEESHQAINQFVERLMADNAINIAYLPDAVERQIYLNVFSLLIGILNQTFQKSQLEFLGHSIKLELKTFLTILNDNLRYIYCYTN